MRYSVVKTKMHTSDRTLSVATLERGSCALSSGTLPLSRASALSLVLALDAVLVDIKLGHEIGLSNTFFFFFSFWFNFLAYQFSELSAQSYKAAQ